MPTDLAMVKFTFSRHRPGRGHTDVVEAPGVRLLDNGWVEVDGEHLFPPSEVLRAVRASRPGKGKE